MRPVSLLYMINYVAEIKADVVVEHSGSKNNAEKVQIEHKKIRYHKRHRGIDHKYPEIPPA